MTTYRVNVSKDEFDTDPERWIRLANHDCIVIVRNASGSLHASFGGSLCDYDEEEFGVPPSSK